ncbi:short-chain fatty acids transporter [Halogranum amylolyticum]|uniref:Short-chain fatty acids transporter n=1 Tax=Halogranum amylolyticum TaxID=660520 RepID=A0A1H8PUG9_9EURY|nr:TIGR00366 family protein [Halogranum amylolyticum]SEO45590.1 short-chain fatty acids transporter [Halogranum amylolyticum]
MANIVRRMAEGSSRLVERFLPEAFLFAILLTFVTYGMAFVFVEPQGSTLAHARSILTTGWYGGFWNLLSFAMQMTLVLTTGYALAQTSVVDDLLSRLATLPSSERSAAAFVPVVAATASFVHWGLGLVVGGLFAQKVANELRGIDFPIVVAGAYSGFVVWHGGLAGSIPLVLNSSPDDGNFLLEAGVLESTIGTAATIFTPLNLVLFAVVSFLFLPALFALMYPARDDEKTPIDPADLDTAADGGETATPTSASRADATFADRIERSTALGVVVGLVGLTAVVLYFLAGVADGVMPWNNLDLNIVNFTLLFLGLLLHGSAAAYIEAVKEAVENVWGIILQFPFYAGIMGIMAYAPEGSTSLATQIAEGMVQLSPEGFFLPAIAFLTAGVVNVFVPSGGGEWAVIGETLVTAAKASGTSVPRVAMAAAWGDAWTNMIQPFWAIPLLAISGLSVRDIMGYCVLVLLGVGGIVLVGVTFLPM